MAPAMAPVRKLSDLSDRGQAQDATEARRRVEEELAKEAT